MTALLRILFAIVLLVSSSLSLVAMAAEGAATHDGQVHSVDHADDGHVEPEHDHEGIDCGMAVCCFMFAAADSVEPAPCPLASPRTVVSAPGLPDRADPHEHPPRQG